MAAPSTAARRVPVTPGRRPSPKATARASSTTPTVPRPATSQAEPDACRRPPDGDATRRKTPIPADMAAAASQSRYVTRPEPTVAR